MKRIDLRAATLTADGAPAAMGNAGAWWRQPMMWLVLGGPFVVVVASFVTLGLAIHYNDPVLDTRVTAVGAGDASSTALLPAVQGRNQAALQGSKAAAPTEVPLAVGPTGNSQDPGARAAPRD